MGLINDITIVNDGGMNGLRELIKMIIIRLVSKWKQIEIHGHGSATTLQVNVKRRRE